MVRLAWLGFAAGMAAFAWACAPARDPAPPRARAATSVAARPFVVPDPACRPAEALPPSAPAVLLEVAVVASVSGMRVPVADHDALRGGDRVAVLVRSSAAGFVRVLARSDDGESRPLSDEPVAVTPGAWLRFPGAVAVDDVERVLRGGGGAWFELPEAPGSERVSAVWTPEHDAPVASLDAAPPLTPEHDPPGASPPPTPERAYAEALLRHRAAHARVFLAKAAVLELDGRDTLELRSVAGLGDAHGVAASFALARLDAHAPRRIAVAGRGAIEVDDAPFRDAAGRYASLADVPAADATSVERVRRRIAEALPPCTTVLHYDLAGDALQIFAVDAGGVRAHAVVSLGRARLDALVARYRASLLKDAVGEVRALALVTALDVAPDASLASAAGELTVALVPPPIAAALATTRHLVVVPTSSIGAVPFAALAALGDGEPLVARMSVTVAPSVRDLWLSPPAWTWPPREALVVGNPAASAAEGVPALPDAEREAAGIAGAVGTTALIGPDATREAVLERMHHADFVYFATHGVADESDPMTGSFLVLAGDRGQWLTPERVMREYRQARMPAALVVLSACQTALGGLQPGGVVGLARAFQMSGAARVVVSQWSVADEPTAALMALFAEELRAHPPSEALRRAMLRLRGLHPEPAFWAPFLVFGTPG